MKHPPHHDGGRHVLRDSDARDVKESAVAVITGNGGVDSPARSPLRSIVGRLHEVK